MKSRAAEVAPGPWGRRLGFALLALFFAAGSLRLFFLVLPRAFFRSALVAEGIVRGEPPWRIFQSRVLGPYLVHAISVIARTSPVEAYAYCALAILFMAGLSVLVLTDRLHDPRRPALASFLIFQAGFVLLLPCIWLYIWDFISMVVFAFFNYFVMRGAGRLVFSVLFLIGILNHEIALFIAAWMVLDPIVKYFASRGAGGKRPAFDRVTMLLGLGWVAGGVALTAFLRRALMVRELPPPDAPDNLAPHWGDFRFALAQNWNSILHAFTLAPQESYQFVVPVFMAAVVVLALWLARSDPARFGALAIVTLMMVASFLCFGLVLETRVLMPLVPFVAMHGWAAVRGRAST
jgi:hypothetical protein